VSGVRARSDIGVVILLWSKSMGLSGCGGITRQKDIVLRRRRVHQIQLVVLWLVGGDNQNKAQDELHLLCPTSC